MYFDISVFLYPVFIPEEVRAVQDELFFCLGDFMVCVLSFFKEFRHPFVQGFVCSFVCAVYGDGGYVFCFIF